MGCGQSTSASPVIADQNGETSDDGASKKVGRRLPAGGHRVGSRSGNPAPRSRKRECLPVPHMSGEPALPHMVWFRGCIMT